MKTPALLMLSALVALGHWLVLAPGADTLAQLTSPGLTAPAAQAAPSSAFPSSAFFTPTSTGNAGPRAMQTRRIESPPLALSVISIAAPEARGAARPAPQVNAQPPVAPQATEARPELSVTAALLESTEPDAALNPMAQPSREKEAGVPTAEPTAEPEEPVSAIRAQFALAPSLASSLASSLALPPAAQFIAHLQLPKAARLNYDITGQSRGLGYRASGLLDWQQDGKHYDARMVASVFFLGSRTLRSQGEVTADGLAPTRFADKARSEQAAHFQPDKGKITFSANTPDAPWQRGAQDRLSVFFQLAGMLAGQPESVKPGTQIPVYTAGARGADTWAFLVDGPEKLTLPAGDMATLKLTRQSRMDYDQTVEIWFAPTMSYWPVRIKVTQRNGDFVDQQLASTP